MTDPEEEDSVVEEVGHSDRAGNLSTPEDDTQVEPGAEEWVEDDAEPGSS